VGGATASGQGHSSSNGATQPSSNVAASSGGFQAFVGGRAQAVSELSKTSMQGTLSKENITQLLKSNGLLQAHRDSTATTEPVRHKYHQSASIGTQEQATLKKLAQLLQTQQSQNAKPRPSPCSHPLAQLASSKLRLENGQTSLDQQKHLRPLTVLPVKPSLTTTLTLGPSKPPQAGPSPAAPQSTSVTSAQPQ
jgi:hypothetical protein